MNHSKGDASDEDVAQAFGDLDDNRAFLEPSEVLQHATTTEKKVDSDFFNNFRDDFDESDMKRVQ